VNLAWHDRQEAGLELHAVTWRPRGPVRVASTTALGGGLGERSWFLNAQVPAGYAGPDPAADLRAIAASLGLEGQGVGMMTARDVRSAVLVDDDGVEVLVTVGLGWPTWAAAPDGDEVAPGAGTINLLVVVPVRLSDAALVNAVATATEAKVQALLEEDVDGTGTASDAVCVAAPGTGSSEPYGGTRSRWGAVVARNVHAAVRRGVR